MKFRFEDNATNGQLVVSIHEEHLKGEGLLKGQPLEPVNTIVCNKGEPQRVWIDAIAYDMPACSVLPLVANQHFAFERPEALVAWQFNRDFYCIVDHDAEVGCVGFLFYGIRHPFFVTLTAAEMEGIAHLERLCVEDMEVRDKMQGEMLRTLLKRLIIKVTRMAKCQSEQYERFTDDKMDVIRRFNLLLEAHFRNHHDVGFYAGAMNKSPKTLTNIFGLCRHPSPSKLIQRRIVLEAKRYLQYTDKSAKEVAAALGFSSTAHFSRFFKANAGVNFSKFR
jgi:AraC family transcriptional activator of pobA